MKTTSKMTNILDKINDNLDTAEKIINELEGIAIKTNQNKTEKKEKI